MGVPAFFRWLCMRNPKIILDAIQLSEIDQFANPIIDNFYIDMNGLIHPAVNPQSSTVPPPTNFQQQCQNVFRYSYIQSYIDKLINIVRPRKLIYMAIDGVAPRAKMNQQRSRRFRSAQERQSNLIKKRNLMQFYQSHGIKLKQIQDLISQSNHFDSNVITPGTQFLHNLSQTIVYYIFNRMNKHPLWAGLIIIFSDANCPGQGQHKLLQFIRQQRSCQDYDPNTRHCLYGADADLLMLGLATHQPYFYVIRQTIIGQNQKICSVCGKTGHFFMDCELMIGKTVINNLNIQVNFQFVKLYIFRQYLDLKFKTGAEKYNVQYNLQRVIDDFNFICIFVGNDFLPHLPGFSIREGGIDALLFLYEEFLKETQDYLTNSGTVNLDSLDRYFILLSKIEENILIEKSKKDENNRRRILNEQRINNSILREKLENLSKDDLISRFKKQLKQINSSNVQVNQNDTIEFFDKDTYKQIYYQTKFSIKCKNFRQFLQNINKSYIEALVWTCSYYYQGCSSWSWYYPFHYSPFASDLTGQLNSQPNLPLSTPFRPFQQLVAVLPPKTSWVLPQFLQPLLSQNSSIGDYFPKSFLIDSKNKKFTWLGQVLLPFIDQERLINAMGKYQTKLTQNQKIRNRKGEHLIFYCQDHPLAYKQQSGQINITEYMLSGHIQKLNKFTQKVQPPFNQYDWQTVQNYIIMDFYRLGPKKKHQCQLKKGIKLPTPQINEEYCMRTDQKSFSGSFIVEVIRRVLGIRQNFGVNSYAIYQQNHEDMRERQKIKEYRQTKQKETQKDNYRHKKRMKDSNYYCRKQRSRSRQRHR